MTGNRTSRQHNNGVDRVSTAGRTYRKYAVFEIRQKLKGGRNGIGNFVIFQSPLLFGRVNLPEMVDARVELGDR